MNTNVVILKGRATEDIETQMDTNPWPILQTAHRQKNIMQAEIAGIEPSTARGKKESCFVVWMGTVKGLIPFSETGLQRQEEMLNMIGSKVPLVIEDLERSKEWLLLSVTKAKARLAVETRKQLKVNTVRVGYVQRMTNKRAYIDLGGVDAILVRDEISWSYVGHPKEALKLGQELKVKITKIDEKTGEVFVSKKALEEDPWVRMTQQLRLRQPYLAEVTGNAANAVYVKLFEGVAGMAPYPKELKVGSRVIVTITSVRPEQRRINCRVIRIVD